MSHGHTASPVKFASCGGVRTVQAALKTPSCDSFRIPVRRSGQTRRVPKRKPDNAFSKTKNGIGHLVASRSQHGDRMHSCGASFVGAQFCGRRTIR